jgi:hypothetical protein
MRTKKNGNNNGNGTIDAWSAFCESMGTRCTFTANGVRCENGVTTGDRCTEHRIVEAPKYIDRNEAIAILKAELKTRSTKTWSVKGGRGTAYGWLTVTAPPKRCNEFGHMNADDRKELERLFRFEGFGVSSQGISIPASSAHYREHIARLTGEPFTVAAQYWD